MTDLAGQGGIASADDLDRAAEELSELARELAPTIEATRRLPDELVDGLRASGLFRAGAPAAVGAPEAPPAVTLRCAEAVARGDASAGWCVSIAATSSLLGGWLPADGLAEVFGDPDTVAAGVWAPRGSARRVDGGYRVSGRWAFCSGIMHSDYLFGGCMVEAEAGGLADRPRARDPDETSWRSSTPGTRAACAAPAVTTPSPSDVFVPDHRSFSLLDPPTSDAALYRFPIFAFFALSIAAAALGNARGAIDDLGALAAGKVGQGSQPHARAAPGHLDGRRAGRGLAARGARVLLRRDRRGVGGGAVSRSRCRWSCAPGCGWRPRTPSGRRPTSRARCTTWAAARRSTTARRCSGASATPTPRPRTSRSTRRPGS